MSFWDCVQEAIDGGEMDTDRGREAQEIFERLRQDYEQRVGPDAARAQAAEDVKRIMAARVGRKRRLTLLTMQTARRNRQLMDKHTTLRGVNNKADALRIFVGGDENSEIIGVDNLRKTLRGYYHSNLTKILSEHSRNLIGNVRKPAQLRNVVRELFGEDVGDQSAKEMADAVRETLNMARKDFNAAGGDIGFLENYGLAMRHNGRNIEAAGFDAWRDYIWQRLDWGRIKDHTTDQPFAKEGAFPDRLSEGGKRADAFLQEVYSNITTNGWSKREPSFIERGLSTANNRADARVLHFRDGESWLDYNKEFGEDDPFTNIMTTLDGYARDTAAMRVLGPNPQAMITFLSQHARKGANEAPWRDTKAQAIDDVNRATQRARSMFDLYSGASQVPVNGQVSEFLAGARSLLVSAQLGSAAVSAVTDVGFQAMAARQVGIDPGKVISRMTKELVNSPTQAIRMGLIADRMATVGASQARYMGEVYTPEVASRFAEFTMRASGLAKWTEAGRHAFQMEFMGLLADEANKGWDAITPALRNVMERKGFTAEEWDIIRATDLHDDQGATFLIPQDIRYRTDLDEEVAEDLSFKLMTFIHEQTEFAVPSASLEAQSMFLEQTRPGTLIGELARSGFMYKSFGMSLLFNQTRRIMGHENLGGRLGYFSAMMALTTVMGAVSLQMKEVLKGRDPRPMDNAGFIGAAVLQGGGFGIFGDFIASEENRFGGGIEATLSGPLTGGVGDLVSLGITGAKELGGDEGARTGREAVNFLRYNTPVTGIWYWKNAFQRGLFDNLQRLVDPEAERAWRQSEKRRVKQYGNPSWWGPGEIRPDRAPNLETMFGN